MNIALIVNRALSKRDYERFGIDALSARFTVWVFDLSRIKIFHSRKDKNKRPIEPIFRQHIIFSSHSDFSEYIEKLSIAYYVDLMGERNLVNLRARRAMQENNATRIVLRMGELPYSEKKQPSLEKFKNTIVKGKFFQKIAKHTLSHMIYKYLEPTATIAVFSGDICSSRYSNSAEYIIWGHSFDYETYHHCLATLNTPLIKSRYAIFLDQNAPAHPDYKFHGNKPPVTQKNYYNSLNKYFDFFEDKTGLEIIIAAHPRSASSNSAFWGNRQFILDNTPQLVRDSEIVLAHYSTAISFAVLWKKPIIQLTTSEYMKSYRWDRFVSFSTLLNLKVVNTDDSYINHDMNSGLYKIDQKSYKKYERDYLKSQRSKLKHLWDLVSDGIVQHNKQCI